MDGKFFKYIARRADHYHTFLFPESIFIVKRNTHTHTKKKKTTLNLDKTKCMLIGSNRKRVNKVYHYYLLLFDWLVGRPSRPSAKCPPSPLPPPPQGARARALDDSSSWPCELERHVFSSGLHENRRQWECGITHLPSPRRSCAVAVFKVTLCKE